ncbi:hypothetical protein HPP92_001868 [Vanilla planifolia]|uniref:carnosine N-methyltransferase n=1 Tax=Vanilla planifolia TaxID=51239 RepID=A0A835S536_VANPL|nr:hypothetical protein HPP92_001868 [Vanilla planifolia]
MNPEMEGQHRRYSKLEEALEIKSLRRIISAYLNYSEAAEEDVRRYEKSFRKLPHEHKALLSHLPMKYQRLRRCISVNSFFIMNMLQAFNPPFDMSQDICIDEHENIDGLPDSHLCTQVSDCNEECSGYFKQLMPEDHGNCPVPTILRGLCGQTLSPNGNSEKQEISSGNSCTAIFRMDASNNSTELVEESKDAKVDSNPDSSLFDSAPNGNTSSLQRDWIEDALKLSVPLVDVDKVRCIIRNIVRDWAVEGQRERDQCYKPILEELNRLFPVRCKERPPSCLVPGAGLGRLALEISCLGFISQGNEFSYYMMICSSFILNQTAAANQWIIYPWIHSNCNSWSDDDQFRSVAFPDIHPASVGISEGFSMCGGDFVEVYNDVDQEASWDAVVTCFFLDTAHNIVEYMEVISKVLKDGGVWINLGPLLYHFADSYGPEEEMSIEISLEDVKKVALHYGFVLEMEKIIETTYTANPRSMMQNHYFAAFWTMKKKSKA